eukprot:6005305-Prymnesium_polylepis.3
MQVDAVQWCTPVPAGTNTTGFVCTALAPEVRGTPNMTSARGALASADCSLAPRSRDYPEPTGRGPGCKALPRSTVCGSRWDRVAHSSSKTTASPAR